MKRVSARAEISRWAVRNFSPSWNSACNRPLSSPPPPPPPALRDHGNRGMRGYQITAVCAVTKLNYHKIVVLQREEVAGHCISCFAKYRWEELYKEAFRICERHQHLSHCRQKTVKVWVRFTSQLELVWSRRWLFDHEQAILNAIRP